MGARSSIDTDNVARFAAVAEEWWDPNGKFAPLHRLNPARLAFIRERCLKHFGRDGRTRAPFSDLRLIDIGCGGGLVAEPMTRLGFAVIGLDAGAVIVATLNRTLRSLALAKIAAEYVLRWIPAGTHDWRKFLTPGELGDILSAAGLVADGPFGLTLDPLSGAWRASSDMRVNYLMTATWP